MHHKILAIIMKNSIFQIWKVFLILQIYPPQPISNLDDDW